jgi:hypothetical protein
MDYNLGADRVDAKGTIEDYLRHISLIPVQIMASRQVFQPIPHRSGPIAFLALNLDGLILTATAEWRRLDPDRVSLQTDQRARQTRRIFRSDFL